MRLNHKKAVYEKLETIARLLEDIHVLLEDEPVEETLIGLGPFEETSVQEAVFKYNNWKDVRSRCGFRESDEELGKILDRRFGEKWAAALERALEGTSFTPAHVPARLKEISIEKLAKLISSVGYKEAERRVREVVEEEGQTLRPFVFGQYVENFAKNRKGDQDWKTFVKQQFLS